jgi:hypothetical protein
VQAILLAAVVRNPPFCRRATESLAESFVCCRAVYRPAPGPTVAGILTKLCDRVPAAIRSDLTYEYRFRGNTVVLLERRPYFRDRTRHTEHLFAKFVYCPTIGGWSLQWPDRKGAGPRIGGSRTFLISATCFGKLSPIPRGSSSGKRIRRRGTGATTEPQSREIERSCACHSRAHRVSRSADRPSLIDDMYDDQADHKVTLRIFGAIRCRLRPRPSGDARNSRGCSSASGA